LAGAQGRKDEGPNKELARELVERKDIVGIRQVAENLDNPDKRVQTDCLSVLEQVGLLEPELIESYVADFLKLVFGKDNRLVWREIGRIVGCSTEKGEKAIKNVLTGNCEVRPFV
jgi:hypothetical protein